MWLYLNDAALSIVAHRTQPTMLLVRSRTAGDIERCFPGHAVQHNPQADYPYRAVIHRRRVAAVISDCIAGIDYDNFKNSIQDHARHAAYFDIYRAGLRLGQLNQPAPGLRNGPFRQDRPGLFPGLSNAAEVDLRSFSDDLDQEESDLTIASDGFDSDHPAHSRPLGFFR